MLSLFTIPVIYVLNAQVQNAEVKGVAMTISYSCSGPL